MCKINVNIWIILLFAVSKAPVFAQPEGSFRKTKLTGDFISEGVAVADLERHDGDVRGDSVGLEVDGVDAAVVV